MSWHDPQEIEEYERNAPRPDDHAAVRAEGRRLLAETTKGPWHQMAAAAWSGTNEDPNLVADCPLYADAIAIVWLRNHADALLADPAPEGLSEGARLIAAERERQVAEEGWTPEHDAEHEDGSILDAASSYVSAVVWVRRMGTRPPMPGSWPWDDDSWKPSDDPVRNLVKAGALIAAEIDRLSASTEEGTDG